MLQQPHDDVGRLLQGDGLLQAAQTLLEQITGRREENEAKGADDGVIFAEDAAFGGGGVAGDELGENLAGEPGSRLEHVVVDGELEAPTLLSEVLHAVDGTAAL